MESKMMSLVGAAFPAIVALSWKLGWFLLNFKKIVQDKKDEKLLKKMAMSLGLILKRTPGNRLIIVRKNNHGIDLRAFFNSLSLLTESATELKKKFLDSEKISFFDENGEKISLKNIFFQKSDNEIEILADLTTR